MVLREVEGVYLGVERGVAIYENPGFPVSKPGVSQSQVSYFPFAVCLTLAHTTPTTVTTKSTEKIQVSVNLEESKLLPAVFCYS